MLSEIASWRALHSQIQHGMSADLSTVVDSVTTNGICIKGVIAVPEVSHDGDLQNLAQSFKNSLDLYANVVKVTVWKFLDVASIFTP